jgi:hypothetical protein
LGQASAIDKLGTAKRLRDHGLIGEAAFVRMLLGELRFPHGPRRLHIKPRLEQGLLYAQVPELGANGPRHACFSTASGHGSGLPLSEEWKAVAQPVRRQFLS